MSAEPSQTPNIHPIPSPVSRPFGPSPETAHQIAGHLAVLRRHRKLALACGVLTAVACLALVAIRGRTVTVSSSILVMTFDRSGASMPLPGMNASAGATGLAAALSGPKADPIQAFLASRALRSRVALALDPEAPVATAADPLRALGYALSVGEGAGGSIRVSIASRTRRHTAAELAQANAAVLEELRSLLSETALTDTQRQRLYTETLLEQNAARRREVEEALMGFSPDGTVALTPDMASALARASSLRERAASLRVNARSLGTDDKSLLDEAAALQSEATRLAKIPRDTTAATSVVLPLARVPLLALEYRRLQGELVILDQIHAFLREHRERALIQEARDAPTFTTIDPASAQSGTVEPRLRVVLVTMLVSSLLVAVGAAYLGAWWHSLKHLVPR